MNTTLTYADQATADAVTALSTGVSLGAATAIRSDTGTHASAQSLTIAQVRTVAQAISNAGIDRNKTRWGQTGDDNPRMFFSQWEFAQHSYNDADSTRWTAISNPGAAAGQILLDTTEAGSYVVNVKADQQASLTSVHVGDPVFLRMDPVSWQTQYPHEVGNTWGIVPLYSYMCATVVAVGATTITISRPLLNRISRDTESRSGRTSWYISYAMFDFAHPADGWQRGMHMMLWQPSYKKYNVYMGRKLAIYNQLDGGRIASGGASVTGATLSLTLDVWPAKPGDDNTSNAVFDVTLNANNAAVRFPGVSCKATKKHVVRFTHQCKQLANQSVTLNCWVENSSGTRISDIVVPDSMGGNDMMNILFTPIDTDTHYLKIQQSGAQDASCYLSQIEYRQIPADADDRLMPASGYVYFNGDSNSIQAQALYRDGTYFEGVTGDPVDAMLTPGRADCDLVLGRFIEQQAYEMRLSIVTDRQYEIAISESTGNGSFRDVNEFLTDQRPFTPDVVATITTYRRGLKYWLDQAGVQARAVLVIGKLRRGEDTIYTDVENTPAKFMWTHYGKTAEYNRATRDLLEWNGAVGALTQTRIGGIRLAGGGVLRSYAP